MSRLANDFGISDVGLKKICHRHRVPTPGRGYWAQLEAGKSPKNTHFAEVADAALNKIEIRAGSIGLLEPVVQIIEAQKTRRRLTAAARPGPAPPPSSTFEPVTDVYHAVRRTVQALRWCKLSALSSEAFGDGLCGVAVSQESIERAAYILDRLARALETKGTPLVPTGQAMQVSVGSDKAVFNRPPNPRAKTTVSSRIRKNTGEQQSTWLQA